MPYGPNREVALACRRRWYQRHKDSVKKQVAIRKRRVADELRSLVDGIKESSGCTDCREMYPHYNLQFDHVRGKKVSDVSKMINRSVSERTIMKEIGKCEVVCANCHFTRTHYRRINAPIVK